MFFVLFVLFVAFVLIVLFGWWFVAVCGEECDVGEKCDAVGGEEGCNWMVRGASIGIIGRGRKFVASAAAVVVAKNVDVVAVENVDVVAGVKRKRMREAR